MPQITTFRRDVAFLLTPCACPVPDQAISELSLLDHAYQTAELCRLHHPELDWLHLAGLLHGLGKLLAHRK